MGQWVKNPNTGEWEWSSTQMAQGIGQQQKMQGPGLLDYFGLNQLKTQERNVQKYGTETPKIGMGASPATLVKGVSASQGGYSPISASPTRGLIGATNNLNLELANVDDSTGEGVGVGPVDTVGDNILAGTATTDWTQLFAELRAAGVDAAEATRIARQQAAENTYAAQLRTAQSAAKQNQLAVQQARQQIAEGSFTRERQLLEAASQRGLGGSGIEQLAKTQQRIGTGQNINKLVQQEIMANEKLQNFLSDVEAQKGTKLAEADAQYYNDLFKLAGNDLENMKFLDSNQYRDKVFDWQQKNANDITANNNLNTRLDLIRILESQDLSDNGKRAVAAMMLDAGKINDKEANELLDQYIGAQAGDAIVKGKFDWTTAIAVGSLAAVGIAAAVALPPLIAATPFMGAATLAGGTLLGATKLTTAAALAKIGTGAAAAGLAGGTAAGVVGGGIGNIFERLSGNIKFNLSGGRGEWSGTRAEAIDKNSPNSLVSQEFGTRPGFKDIDFVLDGTTVKYTYKGQTFDRFNDAQTAWLRQQGR
jgi:hypothetical protein